MAHEVITNRTILGGGELSYSSVRLLKATLVMPHQKMSDAPLLMINLCLRNNNKFIYLWHKSPFTQDKKCPKTNKVMLISSKPLQTRRHARLFFAIQRFLRKRHFI